MSVGDMSKRDLAYLEDAIKTLDDEQAAAAGSNSADGGGDTQPIGNGVDTAANDDDDDNDNNNNDGTLSTPKRPQFVRSASSSNLKVALSAADKKKIPLARRQKARERWERTIRGAMVASKFANVLMNRRQTYMHVDSEGNVFFLIKILFALPQFSLIPLTLLINVYIVVFYNSAQVGVSLSFISFFQIFARSFDVLTDPLMAHISDNLTHTKRGRRIPYMMLCPLYAIAFYVLVSPPLDNSDLATWWFGFSYLIFYLCDTLVNVPFQALGPELTDDTDKRNELYMYVKLAEGVGVMIGTLTPSVMSDAGVSSDIIFKIIAGVFGTWYVISMYALIYNVKERPASVLEAGEIRQPFVTSMFRSMRNKPFQPLMLGWILDFASLAMFVTMMPFFLKYYMEVPEVVLGYAGASLFVSGFCAIPFFGWISQHNRKSDVWYERIKIGKFNAWLTYNAINVVSNFLFLFIGEGDLYYMYFCMIMNGIPIGGQFLIASVLCDVIDYDEFLNFKRNEGQFSVFGTFVPKLVAIPCQSLPLVGMILLGFIDPGEVFDITEDDTDTYFVPQNTRVKWFIRVFYVIVPLCFTTTSFLIKRTFPISKAAIMVDVADGINKHLNGQSAIDPLTGQDVWIEELDDATQYLVYLLDQFTHDHLLWLLSPQAIYNRTKAKMQSESENGNGSGGGSSSATATGGAATDNEMASLGSQSSRPSKSLKKPSLSLFAECFKSEEELYPETFTAKDIKFGKNDAGEIAFVKIGRYEALGIDSGTRKLQRRMFYWVLFFALTALGCMVGVVATWELLTNADFAFVPAVFCLCIGLSITGSGFSYLRASAAKEIREWVEEHNLSEEIIAKCIYNKTKGQHGGAALDIATVQLIDKLIPRSAANPSSLKSLRDVTALVANNQGEEPPEMYS